MTYTNKENSSVKVTCIKTGIMDNNTWLIKNTDSREGFIVDASFHPGEIIERIKADNTDLKGILLTHSHYDHIMSVKEIKEEFKVPVYAGLDEKELLEDDRLNLSYKAGRTNIEISADNYVNDGDEINLCGLTINAIHTPGHTKGGICWYIPEENLLFSGDTLFYRTHGRTDLPTGDSAAIRDSLLNKLFKLPPETKVFPGHGEITDIGQEKKHNVIYVSV